MESEQAMAQIKELVKFVAEEREQLSQATEDSTKQRLIIILEGLEHMIVNKIMFIVTTYVINVEQRDYLVRVLSVIENGAREFSLALYEAADAAIVMARTIGLVTTERPTVEAVCKKEKASQEEELDLSFIKIVNDHRESVDKRNLT